ncbi:HNH endonuclease signature motif containing protein [Cupriavidus sp. SZY C1]|uniref:HNH endonuclease signature motif containing protein n=1 Tax=Cupriavidus sp. SZY C1 TaxID=3055037 RepID=UPI0028B4BEC6|nr:HNH endonuclease signature motif containing protein [Cupriavidus sp. SZY C1]MDT6960440.1 HNH endonuclease signature motif containing protein [Cupriavidus sp. SZY C1]
MVVKRRLRAGKVSQPGPPDVAPASPAATCPLCGRPLLDDASTDLHHPVPRSRGGRAVVAMHRVCHQKIHSVFTEAELATTWHDWDALRAHPAMADFIRWIARKPPGFYDRSRTTNARRGR